MAPKRTTGLEDVPTMKELGYDVTYAVSRGLMVPKGTPPAVIAKLNDACAKATKDPDYAKTLLHEGTDVAYLGPKEYAEYLKKTDQETKEIAKDLGLLKRE
jgi:tripartite-type tricarboxylate transporter receptor subunit TctC